MARCPKPAATATLLIFAALIVVVSVFALSSPATGGSPTDDTVTDAAVAADHDEVSVEIDCPENRVRVTAPEDDEYGLAVTVVNATRSGTSTSASSRSSLSGTATAEFRDGTVVYAFVTDGSDGEPVITESKRCGELPGASAANVADGPTIAVGCDESAVEFAAPEDVAYTARVTSVEASPSGSSTGTVSRTVQGNTTAPIEDGLVIAFAFPESGDEAVSIVRDCSGIGADEPSQAAESCSADVRES